MEIGEAGAVAGDKPQTRADMGQVAGSVNAFTVALDRSAGSASSMLAEPLALPGQPDPGQFGSGDKIEPRARMGDGLVNVGARNEDFASIQIRTETSDSDFRFVGAARRGQYSQLPSADELKMNPAALAAYANEQARANGMYPSDAFEAADWKNLREFAPLSQNAIGEDIGLPAAPGRGGAHLAADGDALTHPIMLEGGAGFGGAGWLGPFAELGPGPLPGMKLIEPGKEGDVAGLNPVSVNGAAATDAFAFGGQVLDRITNTLKPAGEEFGFIAGQRMTGGIFDGFERGIIVPGAGEFVAMAEAGEAFWPRRTSADFAVNDSFASKWKQWSAGVTDVHYVAVNGAEDTATAPWETAGALEDETGDIAAFDPANRFRTVSGENAYDAIRMRTLASSEDIEPYAATSALESEADEVESDIPEDDDTVEIRYAAGSTAPHVAPAASIAAAAVATVMAGPVSTAPARSVDQIVDAYVSGRPLTRIGTSVTEGEIAPVKERLKGELRRNGLDPELADDISDDQYLIMAVAEGIYSLPYHPAPAKPEPAITAAQLHEQLKQYEGPTERPDLWTIRTNRFSPSTPSDYSWVNADPTHLVDPASAGTGGDSSGYDEDRREQRRRQGSRYTGSRKSA